jgi:hypothetical protein
MRRTDVCLHRTAGSYPATEPFGVRNTLIGLWETDKPGSILSRRSRVKSNLALTALTGHDGHAGLCSSRTKVVGAVTLDVETSAWSDADRALVSCPGRRELPSAREACSTSRPSGRPGHSLGVCDRPTEQTALAARRAGRRSVPPGVPGNNSPSWWWTSPPAHGRRANPLFTMSVLAARRLPPSQSHNWRFRHRV